MKNTPRAILTHIKKHPYLWAFSAFVTPPVAMAYNGLLEHWGAESWFVDILGSSWISWLLIAFVEYFFVLIVASIALVLGVRIGQRDTEARLAIADHPMRGDDAVRINLDRVRASTTPSHKKDSKGVGLTTVNELPGDEQQIVPRQFLVRAVFTPDGHDIMPMFFIRNRSRETLSLQLRQARWQHAFAINHGFSAEAKQYVLGPEKDLRITMPGTRIFSTAGQKLHAKLVIDFWKDTNQPIMMEVDVELDLTDFPDRQGVDKPVGIIEHPQARYTQAVID